eukprot:1217931-Rhodomonas_salina.1
MDLQWLHPRYSTKDTAGDDSVTHHDVPQAQGLGMVSGVLFSTAPGDSPTGKPSSSVVCGRPGGSAIFSTKKVKSLSTKQLY